MLIAFTLTIIHLLHVVVYEAKCENNLDRKVDFCLPQSRFALSYFYSDKCKLRSRHKEYCVGMENTKSGIRTRSKYFTGDSEMNSETARKRSIDKEDEDHSPKQDSSSQKSETLEYSPKGSYHYVEEDFGSGEESDDTDKDVKDSSVDGSKAQTIDMSDNSSDDERNDTPWKEGGANSGKYKLRQTTLNFSKKGKKKSPEKGSTSEYTLKKAKYSDSDTMEYRLGYPGKPDYPSQNKNWMFYKGMIASTPDGDLIDNIHKKWRGKYNLLERHHGYIQWLFPIRETGMNWNAQELQLHEAREIQSDPVTKGRVLKSYQLMLDFYGMELVSAVTGEIKRSKNWKGCFDNLNYSSHNYLRITRILKCLGELGFEHLKRPFLRFVIYEGLVKRTLSRAMRSCRDYWIGTVKDDKDREDLYSLITEWS